MKKLIPHLAVKNVKQTIHYFTKNLLFKAHFIQKDNNGNENFAILKYDDVEIMIGYATANLKNLPGFDSISASAVFYIELNDPDEYYEKIKDNAAIIRPIADTKWGTREFWIADDNNYYFSFFRNT